MGSCGPFRRTRCARTLTGREEFLARYTPWPKTDRSFFAAAAAKFCGVVGAHVRGMNQFFQEAFPGKKTYLMSVAAAEGAAGVLLPVHAVERKELTL